MLCYFPLAGQGYNGARREHRLAAGRQPLLALVLMGMLMVCVGGCGRRTTPAPTPLPTPTATVAPLRTVEPTRAGAAEENSVLTLTWWTPEFVSPQAREPAGSLLAQYLADFEAAYEGRVRVVPVLKARYGRGGLFDFLRAAQPVAPGILPDIVTLDIVELPAAGGLGLLQPLDNLLDGQTLARLYPFARQAGQFTEHLLAVQFIADLQHVGYIRSRVENPPDTWDALLAGRMPYLFPIASPQPLSALAPAEDVQPVFISHYLSAGGRLDLTTHQLVLEEQPLLQTLSFYAAARDAGILPAEAAEVKELDEIWPVYVRGVVPIAQVSVQRFLAERANLPNIGFAATPGLSGPAPAVSTGWALAVVTPDPARQQAAAAWIAWLLQPERAGRLAAAIGWLPTSAEALQVAGSDPYYQFLDEQLATAACHPAGAEYSQVAPRLHKAVEAVLKSGAAPEEAVEAALGMPR